MSRRNVNLALFTVALPFGLGIEAFYAVVGLQLATVVYHLIRVVQCWNGEEEQEPFAKQSGELALSSGGAVES